jgi:hypothetical protein
MFIEKIFLPEAAGFSWATAGGIRANTRKEKKMRRISEH